MIESAANLGAIAFHKIVLAILGTFDGLCVHSLLSGFVGVDDLVDDSSDIGVDGHGRRVKNEWLLKGSRCVC